MICNRLGNTDMASIRSRPFVTSTIIAAIAMEPRGANLAVAYPDPSPHAPRAIEAIQRKTPDPSP